jgi:catechol 2,3-dioxygenase-like lactoylglutathione lyase family enzyme
VFDHVTIRASDREASRRFYDTVLAPLGHARTRSGHDADEWAEFRLSQAGGEPTRRLHVGFVSRSHEEVDAFWRAGVEAGHPSDGEPGLRPVYHDDYYGAFLLDPDGNSVEAVFHGRRREPGNVIDHLWLRVAELERSRRFWETIAPALGLGVRRSDRAERVHIERGDRSFALLAGAPTARLHLAFPVAGEGAVREFHRAALAAGYRDDRPPGAPPHHPGGDAASVLDPDGTSVEAVLRDRG